MKRKINDIEFEYQYQNFGRGYLKIINEVGVDIKAMASRFSKIQMRTDLNPFGVFLLYLKTYIPYIDYQVIRLKWNYFNPITWLFFMGTCFAAGITNAKREILEDSMEAFKFFNYNLAPEKRIRK